MTSWNPTIIISQRSSQSGTWAMSICLIHQCHPNLCDLIIIVPALFPLKMCFIYKKEFYCLLLHPSKDEASSWGQSIGDAQMSHWSSASWGSHASWWGKGDFCSGGWVVFCVVPGWHLLGNRSHSVLWSGYWSALLVGLWLSSTWLTFRSVLSCTFPSGKSSR